MKSSKTKHSIDFLFLMVVFLLFTFSAVSVLLLAVNAYRSIVGNSEQNAQSRAVVAYVKEVVHQNDWAGAIDLKPYQGKDVLVVNQGEGYQLLIYEHDGNLCELYTKDGSGVELTEGEAIMPVKSLWMKLDGSILTINCIDESGDAKTDIISIKSMR